MDPVSCWHLSTSPHPHHRQCPPLPSNGGNIALHAVSNPVWTSSQCCCMPLPWLVEEACGHVVDSQKLSSAMLKRTPQLDSNREGTGCADSQVVRAHAIYTVDPGSNPGRGHLLHVTLLSLPFLVNPLSNKGVYSLKKSLKNGVYGGKLSNKSIMVDEPVPDQSSPMETDITPEDNKLGLP